MILRLLTDWIESNGGPLLIAAEKDASVWTGGLWEDEESHYRAACDLSDWTGIVDIEGRLFVVLFGEPLPVIVARYNEATLLLRGLYAESDEKLIVAAAEWASRFDSRATPECEINFACSAGTFVLFDSAYKGAADHCGVRFTIEYSVETIRTYLIKPDEQTAFLVDWMT